MTFSFRPAVRDKTPIMLGIAGPSRSGKTYSALRIARGMVAGDMSKVFFVDTESGRALQYAETFGQFMHLNLGAPFTSDRYRDAILAAEAAGAVVVIVDSQSHEHEGPGGILEQHEAELDRMAGSDFGKRERMKFAAWIKPKQAHNRLVNKILQVNCHQIYCFRAKDKLALVKNEKGKQEPVSMGWQPICADRFEYEMSGILVLPEGARGVPDLDARATGLREPLDRMVRPGEPLDEALGERLAAWSTGGAGSRPKAQQPTPGDEEVKAAAKAAAESGTEAFRSWWASADQPSRAAVKPLIDQLRDIAQKADSRAAEDEDPFGGDDRQADRPLMTQVYNADGEAVEGTVSTVADFLARVGRMIAATDSRDDSQAIILANGPAWRDIWSERADAKQVSLWKSYGGR